MAFYIESADRPHTSRIAGEDIHVGELVVEQGDGTVDRADAQNDSDFDGVADAPHRGNHIAPDPHDATGAFVYEAADNDRVPFGGEADGDHIKVRVPEDTGGNESSPNITDGDVVGFIDTSAGTLSSTDEYKGRVVEEGYTDGESSATTYNRSNNNFTAIGTALRDSATDWDDVVRVQVAGGDRSNL